MNISKGYLMHNCLSVRVPFGISTRQGRFFRAHDDDGRSKATAHRMDNMGNNDV